MASIDEGGNRVSYWLAAIVGLGAVIIAVIGSQTLGKGTNIDFINLFVERLSGRSGSFLGGLVGATSLFAFAAGLASAVNPCGFAMLPAYLGLYLGSGSSRESAGVVFQLGQAVLVGVAVSAGFVVLFGVAGTAIGLERPSWSAISPGSVWPSVFFSP